MSQQTQIEGRVYRALSYVPRSPVELAAAAGLSAVTVRHVLERWSLRHSAPGVRVPGGWVPAHVISLNLRSEPHA